MRPHLEFASPAWSPWLRKDIERLDKVQERVVRQVGGLTGGTYEEKLLELGLSSLAQRRDDADLILVYKVLNGNCKVKREDWPQLDQSLDGPVTRAPADGRSLIRPRARLDIRENFYSVRIAGMWNALPSELRSARTVNQFKRGLRAYCGDTAGGDGDQHRQRTTAR